MKWFNKQHKEGVSYDQVAFSLIKLTRDIVKDASRYLEKHLDAQDRSLLPKVRVELMFFFLFSLDYWCQTVRARTQEEKRIWGEIFGTHLTTLFGADPKGLAMFDTFQERLIAYAEIANQKKDDKFKFFGFGMKLSEFCGMPMDPFLLALAPDLFTKALEAVSSFRRQR